MNEKTVGHQARVNPVQLDQFSKSADDIKLRLVVGRHSLWVVTFFIICLPGNLQFSLQRHQLICKRSSSESGCSDSDSSAGGSGSNNFLPKGFKPDQETLCDDEDKPDEKIAHKNQPVLMKQSSHRRQLCLGLLYSCPPGLLDKRRSLYSRPQTRHGNGRRRWRLPDVTGVGNWNLVRCNNICQNMQNLQTRSTPTLTARTVAISIDSTLSHPASHEKRNLIARSPDTLQKQLSKKGKNSRRAANAFLADQANLNLEALEVTDLDALPQELEHRSKTFRGQIHDIKTIFRKQGTNLLHLKILLKSERAKKAALDKNRALFYDFLRIVDVDLNREAHNVATRPSAVVPSARPVTPEACTRPSAIALSAPVPRIVLFLTPMDELLPNNRTDPVPMESSIVDQPSIFWITNSVLTVPLPLREDTVELCQQDVAQVAVSPYLVSFDSSDEDEEVDDPLKWLNT
ncbi:hypothetical protein DAPPUDRAFT_102056 [Daphnia pulex]|uniref:Uncharacterized protein n=1 Tax=Daphnia pulex TaxID=6669 RepID=E9GF82_DAPPU|nr:hypothetical protein DAPPUDRAFT_102056 [Daphnia pulex]|eukprot:EFX81592.1 hypothetical protein DAPPUDRAFT_102056 [Daphnia pulex]